MTPRPEIETLFANAMAASAAWDRMAEALSRQIRNSIHREGGAVQETASRSRETGEK